MNWWLTFGLGFISGVIALIITMVIIFIIDTKEVDLFD
jgi:hypothetical protein